MAIRGPRLEFSVGAFLLLGLGSLLVLALASTNRKIGNAGSHYQLTARFSQIGQLRERAPVRIGGVAVGQVERIDLDPKTYQSVVSLAISDRYRDLSADTSAGIYTSGLLGDSYIGLSPGGDPDVLKPGDEIAYTQPAVDLLQLVGKYMFSGGGKPAGEDAAKQAPADPATPPAPQGEAK
ncbi:MAG: outer membrane lipid asymmetry maintenance protein MlaD [Pseudoxanthomonas sp.]